MAVISSCVCETKARVPTRLAPSSLSCGLCGPSLPLPAWVSLMGGGSMGQSKSSGAGMGGIHLQIR